VSIPQTSLVGHAEIDDFMSPGKDLLVDILCVPAFPLAIARLFRYNSTTMSPFEEKRFLPKRTATAGERERLTQAVKERLMRETDILFAYLHGSFVNAESFRDIDVGIFTAAPKGFSFESDLSCELSHALGHDVEVRAVNEAPVAFQMAVLRDGIALFSRSDDARADFIEGVGRRYREYAHFRNIFMEAVGAEQ